jgi:hypothetical protein
MPEIGRLAEDALRIVYSSVLHLCATSIIETAAGKMTEHTCVSSTIVRVVLPSRFLNIFWGIFFRSKLRFANFIKLAKYCRKNHQFRSVLNFKKLNSIGKKKNCVELTTLFTAPGPSTTKLVLFFQIST